MILPTLGARAKVIAGALAAACVMWSPAFFSPLATGFGDWQFFHHMWEAGYVALTRYGEWPLWDPYHCGGITIFGNPQSQMLSPLFWPAFLIGPTLGSKLFLVLHAAAGFAGMYVLARTEYRLRASGASLASLAWAGSGFFASHGSGGHSAFLPFYLAPLMLLLWNKALLDIRWAAWLAAALALVLLEGGVYPFPYFLLLLAFAALSSLVRTRALGPVLSAGAKTLVLTALLGAVRLLPIVEELRSHPRTMSSSDGVSAYELLLMLTTRDLPWHDRSWGSGGHQFVWAEYGSYVGYAVLALGALGLLLSLRQRQLTLAAGVLVFGWLTLGDHGVVSVWSLVHRLPIYDSLRVPSRFAVLMTLFVALAAGRGLDALRARFGWRTLPWLVLLAIAIDFGTVHYRVLNRWKEAPVPLAAAHERFYLAREYPYAKYYASFPRMNVGTMQCYEAMSFTPARGLWWGDGAQARVLGDGQVLDWGRTTTHVWADVKLNAASRVLFNQNYASGWRATTGRAVEEHGKLAVDAQQGLQRIELVYRPPTLAPGIALSALGLALSLLLWLRQVKVSSWSRSEP